MALPSDVILTTTAAATYCKLIFHFLLITSSWKLALRKKPFRFLHQKGFLNLYYILNMYISVLMFYE